MQLGLWIIAALLIIAFAVLKPILTGKDGYSGTTLKLGISTLADVEGTMGKPAETWKNDAGQVVQLAYPRGPAGYVSFMVHMNPAGTVASIEQVLDERHFDLVKQGATETEVLRILGPQRSKESFKSKNRLYWNYGYCSMHGRRMERAIEFDLNNKRVTGQVEIPDPLVNASESGFCSPWRDKS